MKFRLRQMEIFRAVMLTGSINGAAKLLFVSQPVVSRIVSHTEQTLGLKLFNRIKGKLVPTPEGKALFLEVDAFYQSALRVDAFAQNLAQGPSGTLNITSSPCLSYNLVPQAMTRFINRYPNIRVNYHTTLLNDMAPQILSHKVDLAISVLPLEHPNLRITPFTQGRMVCVMPPGHPLASLPEVSLTDICNYPLIAHHPSIPFSQLVSAAFKRAGVVPTNRIHIYQTEVACSLVRAGAGIALVDEFTVGGGAWRDLHVAPLAENLPLTPSIIRSAFDGHDTHADKFIEVLLECHESPLPAADD
jgi:DNA-binding transcriptional LysR family regulator